MSLPAGWAEVRLGEVADVQLGKMLSAKSRTGKGSRPYLRNVNVRWGTISTDDLLQMDFNGREAAKYELLAGDVLVCEGGEPGRAAVWRNQLTGALYQKALHRVRFVDRVLEPALFFYQLEWAARAGMLAAHFTGSTIKHLPREAFLGVPVRVPPKPEQRRIVAAIEEHLSRLDAAVAGLKRVQAQLPRYRAAVLKAAVEGATESLGNGLRWLSLEQCALSEAGSIADGPFGSNLKTEDYTSAGPRVIRLQNVGTAVFIDERAHVSEERFRKLRKHEALAGDVIIAALGEVLPRACVVPAWLGPAIVKADCFRLRPDPAIARAEWLSIVLNSQPIRARASLLIKGVGRPRLNLTAVRALQVPVPSVPEQDRLIAEVQRGLSVADAVTNAAALAVAKAVRARVAILRHAFSGQLVPQDPNDEPASVLLERIRAARVQAPPARRPRRARRT